MIITMADRLPHGRMRFRRTLLPVLIGLAFAPCSRADVTFTPSITIKETWSDNTNLAPSGFERSNFITELTPGFSVSSNSQRVQLAASYYFQRFFYSNEDTPGVRDSSSQMEANLKANLVNELLFLDATGSRGQQAVSAFGAQLTNTPYATNNRTDVSTWRISPYLAHRFASFANLNARYTRDSVKADRSGFGDSQGESASASLSSVGDRRIGWYLNYEHQDLKEQVAGETSSSTAQAGLSWRVLAPLTLTASGGYDDYDYNSLGGSTRGKSWNIGYRYTPSARTSLSMSYGHRYFGKSRSLSALHRSRQTTWNINYDESVTTSRSQFLIPATVDTAGMLSNLFAPSFPDIEQRRRAVEAYMRLNGLPATLANDINYLSNRYMLQQQFQASVGFTGVRSVVLLSAYDTRRTALSVQQTDSALLGSNLFNLNDSTRQRGIGANLNYRLSSRANAFMQLEASRSTSLSTGIKQDIRTMRLGVNRQFQRRLNSTLELRRHQGSSDGLNQSYTENAVSATLSMTL